jgi:hypothetical protein
LSQIGGADHVASALATEAARWKAALSSLNLSK